MTGRLQAEIKQSKPFASLEEEVVLNIHRTSDAMERRLSAELKKAGLSTTQYNVLRILRGAGDSGRTCSEIGERLITRDPDITRLLDRLEKRGLLRRERQAKDRRVITVFAEAEGLAILKTLDKHVPELMQSMLSHMGERKLRDLCRLLEEARDGSPT
jgi:MarR family transcriptional regulator, organic hydroperoxide resistance regulator